eukprot:gb/GFBE01041649.1/.p1 GENE.gb/GFBE01041649.1/~~gb/GFBE01041649.1/.p1  ORF type:complete len:647 (+),score=157.18 gb/GFBE01041649.1/:2-1942(+)
MALNALQTSSSPKNQDMRDMPARSIAVTVSGVRPAGTQPHDPSRPVVSCDVRPAKQRQQSAGSDGISRSGRPKLEHALEEMEQAKQSTSPPSRPPLPNVLESPADSKPGSKQELPVGYVQTKRSEVHAEVLDEMLEQKHKQELEEKDLDSKVKHYAASKHTGAKFAEMAKSMGIDYEKLDTRRQFLHRWISWQGFDTAIGIIIIANAATIGLETQANADIPTGCDKDCKCGDAVAQVCHGIPKWLDYIDYVFFGIYVIEFGLRYYTYGRAVLKSNWVKFDLFLVISSTLDILLQQIKIENEILNQIMLVRIMRLARLARAVRLMVQFRVLWQLVQGLMHSVGTLLWTFILVMLLIYGFAIMGIEFIQLDTNLPLDHPYNVAAGDNFRSFPDAILTLLQCFTLDSIGGIYRPLIHQNPVLLLYFMGVLLIMSIALMNLVTAVMVNSALDQATEDKDVKKAYEDAIKRKQMEKLKVMFIELDADGSGELTMEELDEAPEEVMNQLKEIAGTDDIEGLFDMLDYDGGGSLSTDEFCEGVMRASTSDQPMELLRVMKQCGDILQNSKHLISKVDEIHEAQVKPDGDTQTQNPMEDRVAKMETRLAKFEQKVDKMRLDTRVAQVEEKVDRMHQDLQKILNAVCPPAARQPR